jgi:DNA recombination protein RmuC
MQTLAAGVGDLKKVLTNVKTRGTWGEVQLEALLEQMLTPDQYAKNVATVPKSSERVEFAIRLPAATPARATRRRYGCRSTRNSRARTTSG